MALLNRPLYDLLQHAPALISAISPSFKTRQSPPGQRDDADELTGCHFITDSCNLAIFWVRGGTALRRGGAKGISPSLTQTQAVEPKHL